MTLEPEALEAAKGAEKELWELEEHWPDAVKLMKDWFSQNSSVGYRTLAKILVGKSQFADSV